MLSAGEKHHPIKCVVWDLDNTVWRGVLLEGAECTFRPGIVEAMNELDRRGILQSIASRNDYEAAKQHLIRGGVWELFLHPQIQWGAKSASVRRLSEVLNIGLNTMAFIDDDPFERDEVRHQHRDVLCVNAEEVEEFLRDPRATPAFITAESSLRRQMYQGEAMRARSRDDWSGTEAEFLATLGLELTIRRATREDLQRAEELTVRTNQLNSTGQTYSYDELDELLDSNDHRLLVASLTDKYGTYGSIGLCLLRQTAQCWRIKLLLMSCRVMNRGAGAAMLAYIMNMARDAGVALQADFVPTEKNRVMYVTYKFAGFTELDAGAVPMLLQADLSEARRIGEHLRIVGPNLTSEGAR